MHIIQSQLLISYYNTLWGLGGNIFVMFLEIFF